MGEETRESRSIKIKPSILRKARHAAIEEGKSLGQWIEDAIEEKLAREQKEQTGQNRKDIRRRLFLR